MAELSRAIVYAEATALHGALAAATAPRLRRRCACAQHGHRYPRPRSTSNRCCCGCRCSSASSAACSHAATCCAPTLPILVPRRDETDVGGGAGALVDPLATGAQHRTVQLPRPARGWSRCRQTHAQRQPAQAHSSPADRSPKGCCCGSPRARSARVRAGLRRRDRRDRDRRTHRSARRGGGPRARLAVRLHLDRARCDAARGPAGLEAASMRAAASLLGAACWPAGVAPDLAAEAGTSPGCGAGVGARWCASPGANSPAAPTRHDAGGPSAFADDAIAFAYEHAWRSRRRASARHADAGRRADADGRGRHGQARRPRAQLTPPTSTWCSCSRAMATPTMRRR